MTPNSLTKRTPTSIKFMIVGLSALLFSGFSLAFLGYSIDGIQQLISQEVASHYQAMELDYPLEKVIFELEKDIAISAELHLHNPYVNEPLKQEILNKISILRGEFKQRDATEQQARRLELLSRYEETFKRYISQNAKTSNLLLKLNQAHGFFLGHLAVMEKITGEKMVEFALAGKDTTVLRQIFAIIPLCREQVLEARYHIEVKVSENHNRSPRTGENGVDHLVTSALQTMEQALDTLTGGFPEIFGHAQTLIEAIPAYKTMVVNLHQALDQYARIETDLGTVRGSLVTALELSRGSLLSNMDKLQASTRTFSRHALLVTYVVSFLVLGTFLLAWLIMRGFGRKTEQAMYDALLLKQQLEEKNTALLQQIAAREKGEENNKRLASQLQQAQKMEAIGTLAGGIAHDFNNILAAVFGYTELGLRRASRAQDNSRELTEIKKASLRAKKLILQILFFSRSSEQNLLPVQLGPIVEEAVKLLQSTLPSTIEINLRQTNSSRLVVMADQTQLLQIIMNLCTNAYHAMRNCGGQIDIILTETKICGTSSRVCGASLPEGNYVKILIKDNGSGIAPEVIDRIFDPYFTTKDRGEGTGMGLAVVHGILKAHNGAICCSSELGIGTTFDMLLPRAAYVGAETELPAEEEPCGGSERILLVDDESVIIDLQKNMLQELGYQVTASGDSTEAFTLFQANPDQFDLVITDMTMPRMTGSELAEKLLALSPDLPILMCTGYSELIDEQKARQLGINGFLMKPVFLPELARNIRLLLDR